MKRLRNKPVNMFEGEEDFLCIVQAEKESLLTVSIEVQALPGLSLVHGALC